MNNQYSRNDAEIAVAVPDEGNVLEIGPAYEDRLVRMEVFGDEVGDSLPVGHHRRDPQKHGVAEHLPGKTLCDAQGRLVLQSVQFARSCGSAWMCSMAKESC